MSDELPHTDNLSFSQLCRATAWQLTHAFHRCFPLDDEQQAKVEEAIGLALQARPASLEALLETNVMPEGLIQVLDEDAERGGGDA